MPLSVDQFAQKIKTKYPQYQGLDNADLVTKITTKYPAYKDQVDLGSPVQEQAPQEKSLLQKAGDASDTFLGGMLNAVKGVGNALTSSEQKFGQTLGDTLAVSKIPLPVQKVGQPIKTTGGDLESAQQGQTQLDDINKKLGQKILEIKKQGKDTSRMEAVYKRNTEGRLNIGDVVPSTNKTSGQIAGEGLGTAMDVITAGAPTGKGLLAKTAIGGTLGYGFDVSQNLQKGKTGFSAATPGLGTAVGATLPFATHLLGSLTKKITGALSGTGEEVIQRAIDNPETIQDAMKKYARDPEAKQQLLDQAQEAVSTFQQQKQQEYAQALSKLQPKGPINPDIVDTTFEKTVKGFGGSITQTADEQGNIVKTLSFQNSSLTKADQSNLLQAWDSIQNWTDTSPQGLDKLRQNIGNYMDDFKLSGNTRANVVLGRVKDSLTKELKNNITGYGDMLSTYGEKSQAANEFLKEFQLGGAAKDSTKINNLMRFFKKDPTYMQSFEQVFGKKGAEDFQNEIAGSILSHWIPPGKLGNAIKGLGEIGGIVEGIFASNPGLAVTGASAAAATSPRIVGTGATLVGKAAQAGVGTAAKRIMTKMAGQSF